LKEIRRNGVVPSRCIGSLKKGIVTVHAAAFARRVWGAGASLVEASALRARLAISYPYNQQSRVPYGMCAFETRQGVCGCYRLTASVQLIERDHIVGFDHALDAVGVLEQRAGVQTLDDDELHDANSHDLAVDVLLKRGG
jgi:hypothetical protein